MNQETLTLLQEIQAAINAATWEPISTPPPPPGTEGWESVSQGWMLLVLRWKVDERTGQDGTATRAPAYESAVATLAPERAHDASASAIATSGPLIVRLTPELAALAVHQANKGTEEKKKK